MLLVTTTTLHRARTHANTHIPKVFVGLPSSELVIKYQCRQNKIFTLKQDKQCTYNVTLWRGSVIVVAVKTQECIVCVCVVPLPVAVICTYKHPECRRTFRWQNYVAGNRRPRVYDMTYDIFVNCNWVVTRWQYRFTHKQYTEQHK